MKQHVINLTVNGSKRTIFVEPNELLLNVLRDKLHLTGTKYGCGIAECGACSIIANGKLMLACMVLAVTADGWEIVTSEGLATGDELNPVQQAFIDKGAIQCGFCTPGMVVAGTSLLNENPHPTEEEIRDYMRGNYCRCTGYSAIVEAITQAADTRSI
ncbi:(2Fe-2S)-binding protein [Christensenellaceae bacterium OttesenSCG-928-M15]|nr:(2Fe-2S)-binding protein [Christensenellaceae bacterium OttesenSCG-928-M15]